MINPFIIYALPRSRTAWLSNFLTYGDWTCHHEHAIFMRSIGDIKDFFSHPNIGCAETAAVAGRHLIHSVCPNIKEVVILRPVDEVVDSFMNLDISDIATYNREKLQKVIAYEDRMLRKITEEPNVLTVNFEDLKHEETCAKIFEHCLPYKFDKTWWESLKNKNIQVDVKDYIVYYHKHKGAIEEFKRCCKRELRRLYYAGLIPKKVKA